MRHGDCWIAVISAGRPGNVHAMTGLLGEVPATWYVADAAQQVEYAAAGARQVVAGGSLIEARNAALRDAWHRDLTCVQVSDDLRRLEWYNGAAKEPLTFADAAYRLDTGLTLQGAMLAGCSPTANAYFYRKPVSPNLFVVGDLIAVRPCWLWFDAELPLKEDYDYTLQHLRAYGQVARLNRIMPTFRHRSNAGGAVAYRTPDLEDQAIAYLRAKWGDCIRPNTRRPHEVLLRWKP